MNVSFTDVVMRKRLPFIKIEVAHAQVLLLQLLEYLLFKQQNLYLPAG